MIQENRLSHATKTGKDHSAIVETVLCALQENRESLGLGTASLHRRWTQA
ncbi:hypothetical protein GCM10027403_35570 [Arthrobacter tecti]